MALGLARALALPKPCSVVDPTPWNKASNEGISIGEICYGRPGQPRLRQREPTDAKGPKDARAQSSLTDATGLASDRAEIRP
jgi:hypothetical protein